MVLETSWDARTRLDHRPRRAADRARGTTSDERSHTHRRAPTDYDADHVPAAHGPLRQRRGPGRASTASRSFDYGARAPARGPTRARATTRRIATADGADVELRLTTDLRLGFEGPRATARHADEGGRHAASARCRGASTRRRRDLRRGLPAAGLDRAPLAALARPRPASPTTRGGLPAAQRADPEGPDATRPPGRCVAAATTSLPETPGGERNWDYRYTWIRDATFTLWGLYTLGFDWEANDFFYFIADVAERRAATCRSCTASAASATCTEERSTTWPDTRTRGRCGSATAPTTRPSTTSGARCSTRSSSTRSRATTWPSGSGRCSQRAGRGRRSRTGASPTAASGRCAASRSTSRRRR